MLSPLLPTKQTSNVSTSRSDKGQQATSAVALFDRVIGARKHSWRKVKAKRLGSFHVDHQLVRRLLDRQIGRLGALQNLVHEASRSTPTVTQINTIAQQPTSLDKLTV